MASLPIFLILIQPQFVVLFITITIIQVPVTSSTAIPNTVPNPDLCASRRIHSKLNSTGYFFNWLEPDTKSLGLNWFDARSYCQTRCMDLISLESLQEIAMLKKYIQFGEYFRNLDKTIQKFDCNFI